MKRDENLNDLCLYINNFFFVCVTDSVLNNNNHAHLNKNNEINVFVAYFVSVLSLLSFLCLRGK